MKATLTACILLFANTAYAQNAACVRILSDEFTTSGAYIGKDAAGHQHILTCAHGKEKWKPLKVLVGKKWVTAVMVAADTEKDIGDVVLLEEVFATPVRLGRATPEVGATVHVQGWGTGVKADRRTKVIKIEENGWIRVEAPGRMGDSGAPVFASTGPMVGGIVGIHIRGDGHDGWEVPIEQVHEFYEQSGSWKNAEGQHGP